MTRAYAKVGDRPTPLAFAASEAGDVLTLDLLDFIGEDFFGEGITSKRVAASLAASTAKTIRVRINSPGGDAYEGTAIRSLLRAHALERKARIEVEVHGVAASAASVIMLAGDSIAFAPDAFVMIHEAWVWAVGEADDLRATADVLDKLNDSMARMYASASKLDAAEMRAKMADETWFDANQAADVFGGRVLDESIATVSAVANERFFAALNRCEHAPDDLRLAAMSEKGALLVAAMASETDIDRREAPRPQSDERTDKPMNLQPVFAALGLDPKAEHKPEAVAAAIDAIKNERDEYKVALGEKKTELRTVRAERDALKTEADDVKIAARLDRLQAAHCITPDQRAKLDEKYQARKARGPVAVELFVEDLEEIEAAGPHPFAGGPVEAPSADIHQQFTVTPAMRAEYGPDVSDEDIIAAEKRFRAQEG